MLDKKKLIKWLQIFIALGVFYFLYSQINLQQFIETIHDASISYLFLALFLLIGQMTLAAYRWFLVVRMNGFLLPLNECIGSFAASSFVNTTLPVSITGDLMRIWVATRRNIPTTISLNNVLLDRILNTVSLALLVFMTQIPFLIHSKYQINTIASWFSLALIGAFIGLAFIEIVLKRFKKLTVILSPIKMLSQMTQQVIKQPHRTLLSFTFVLYMGHFLLVAAIILIAKSLHTELPFYSALMSIPIAMLFSIIPITPGNWGIREGIMVVILNPLGISAEVALSISIIFGLGTVLSSVPGALVWFIKKNWSKKTLISLT